MRIPNVWNPFYENHRHRRHIVIVPLKQQVENDDTNDGLPLLSDIPENRLCRILHQRYFMISVRKRMGSPIKGRVKRKNNSPMQKIYFFRLTLDGFVKSPNKQLIMY